MEERGAADSGGGQSLGSQEREPHNESLPPLTVVGSKRMRPQYAPASLERHWISFVLRLVSDASAARGEANPLSHCLFTGMKESKDSQLARERLRKYTTELEDALSSESAGKMAYVPRCCRSHYR